MLQMRLQMRLHVRFRPEKTKNVLVTKNHALHLCPYEEDVNGNDDPEYCTCCPWCEQGCANNI